MIHKGFQTSSSRLTQPTYQILLYVNELCYYLLISYIIKLSSPKNLSILTKTPEMGLQFCCCQMSNHLIKKYLTKTGEFMADLVLLNLRPEAALLKKAQA